MFIPLPILGLLVSVYLLSLLSAGWVLGDDGASGWHRPFLLGLLVIVAAWWVHRERDSHEP